MIILKPLLVLPFLFFFSSIPWWKMIWYLMVVVYVSSLHVPCRKYLLMPFVIIIYKFFSSFSSPEKPFMFWFMILHVYGQVYPVLVAVHAPCPGERESSSGVINSYDGEWLLFGGRLQASYCSTLNDFAIGGGCCQVSGLSMCVQFLRWPRQGRS